ncbi:hypothetical protein SPRG_16946, partial [Saprolegnia parasitica CBS 223.65]
MFEVSALTPGPLLFQSWTPVIVSIDGQRLRVDYGASHKSFDTTGCAAHAIDPPFLVEIAFSNKKKLLLDMGSRSLRTQLIERLTATATSTASTDTADSVHDQLLSVAAAITDRAAVAKKSDLRPCNVSVADVHAHLCGLKDVYDHVAGLPSPLALYDWLLDTEAAYVDRHRDLHGSARPDVYAHTVYQQDPLSYALGTTSSARRPDVNSYIGVCSYCKTEYDRALLPVIYVTDGAWPCPTCHETITADVYFKNRFDTMAFDEPLRRVLAPCPTRRCPGRFTRPEMQRLHLFDKPAICAACKRSALYETYQIATLVREHPSIRYQSVRNADGTYISLMPTQREMPVDGLWSTYLHELHASLHARRHGHAKPRLQMFEVSTYMVELERAVTMIRAHDNGAFPIDLVRAMHRDLRFVAKIGPMTHYWSNPTVVAAAIRRYEQFMHLSKTHKHLVPTLDIALLWRVHMTQHVAYCAYSRAITKKVLSPQWNSYDDAAYVKTCVAWDQG